jgi:hypothetical protein
MYFAGFSLQLWMEMADSTLKKIVTLNEVKGLLEI